MAQFIDSYGIALAKGMDWKSQVQGNSTPKGELKIKTTQEALVRE